MKFNFKQIKMKRLLTILVLSVMLVGLSSCAKTCNRMKANGSVIGSTKANWVVISRSGGKTTDVYCLYDVMVQSEPGSDGWLFIDNMGDAVHIGGDMKAIRFNQAIPNEYFEYHAEFDSLTFEQRLKLRMVQPLSQAAYQTPYKIQK